MSYILTFPSLFLLCLEVLHFLLMSGILVKMCPHDVHMCIHTSTEYQQVSAKSIVTADGQEPGERNNV